jgi:hypothetical protein
MSRADEQEYSDLVLNSPHAMFTHTLEYRNFLSRTIRSASELYLLVRDDKTLMAALPMFLIEGPLGRVINSLPFFGSNGGLVARPEAPKAVYETFDFGIQQTIADLSPSAVTIVDGIFGSASTERIGDGFDLIVRPRIAQVTTLPGALEGAEVGELLMNSFHSKNRNLIRKGLKSGFQIGHGESEDAIKELYEIHRLDMETRLGGIAKPSTFVQAVLESFKYDKHYRLYTAKIDGELAAGLLVFFFRNQVEYFFPVVKPKFKSLQPLSALIFHAMHDSVVDFKSEVWNWGGTRPDQISLRHFKSRWGADEVAYESRTYVSKNANLSDASIAASLASYPNFFIAPFSSTL